MSRGLGDVYKRQAVIDSVPRGEYQVMKFNNPELMNWMKKGIGE